MQNQIPELINLPMARRVFIEVMLYLYDKERGSQAYMYPLKVSKIYYMLTGRYMPKADPERNLSPVALTELAYYLDRLAEAFNFNVINKRKRRHIVLIDMRKLRQYSRGDLMRKLIEVTE